MHQVKRKIIGCYETIDRPAYILHSGNISFPYTLEFLSFVCKWHDCNIGRG